MSFDITTYSDYAAVAGPPRLNMVTAPGLRAAVADALRSGQKRLVLDLAATEFIDSSGLGALVACLREARQDGGDLRVASIGPQVEMVLELTGTRRIILAYPSVEAAYATS